MSYRWGARSLRNLDEVRADGVRLHPDLRRLADCVLARNKHDLTVLDNGALRSLAAAQANVAAGTGVLNSRHLDGNALDLVTLYRGKLKWPQHAPAWERTEIFAAFRETAETVAMVAAELSIPIVQGCDWDCDGIMGETGEWDWPHVQIPWPYQIDKATRLMKIRREQMGLPG